MAELTHDEIEAGLRGVQDHIANWVVKVSGQQYLEEKWSYAPKGEGGGRTRVWEGKPGDFMEKGGVNFSAISGKNMPSAALNNMKGQIGEQAPEVGFFATGVSLVFHPSNPNVPTIHMNVRYFETGDKWWFGGGIDLTPYYPNIDQVIGFHQTMKDVCERHGQPYEDYKVECDKYFLLKHRGETRGIGGIFFEYLRGDKRKLFEFIQDVGKTLTTAWEPVVLAGKDKPYTEAMREYQLLRRGRYAEFNLAIDRGTKFGLESEGRTESILMSLPTIVKWKYGWKPAAGSIEEKVMTQYLKPQDWLKLTAEQTEALRIVVQIDQNDVIDPVTGKKKCCHSQWYMRGHAGLCLFSTISMAIGAAGAVAAMRFLKK